MSFAALQRQVEAVQAVKYIDQIGQRRKPHSVIQMLSGFVKGGPRCRMNRGNRIY